MPVLYPGHQSIARPGLRSYILRGPSDARGSVPEEELEGGSGPWPAAAQVHALLTLDDGQLQRAHARTLAWPWPMVCGWVKMIRLYALYQRPSWSLPGGGV